MRWGGGGGVAIAALTHNDIHAVHIVSSMGPAGPISGPDTGYGIAHGMLTVCCLMAQQQQGYACVSEHSGGPRPLQC